MRHFVTGSTDTTLRLWDLAPDAAEAGSAAAAAAVAPAAAVAEQ